MGVCDGNAFGGDRGHLSASFAARPWSLTLGGGVGLGYAAHPDGVSRAWVENGRFEIVVEGERVPARASLHALYDPKGARARG